jgi:membrane protein DedA with SNARE-associated domain
VEFDQLTELVAESSGWAYAIVFLFAFLDLFFPFVPSETAVITAGVVAAAGDLTLGLIVAAAAGGAFLGDNTAYLVGRRFGQRALDRFGSGGKGRARADWGRGQLQERGGTVIVSGRFVPGGRTAVTLSAGTLRYRWRRFVAFDVVAVIFWALFASLLGYFGGRTFEEEPWKGLLLALGIGFSVAGLAELVRWAVRRKRAPRDVGSPR